MRLTELEPQFLKFESEKIYAHVDQMIGADGIMLTCPKCFLEKSGLIGAHKVICWQPHIPQTVSPQPGRWSFHGSGYNDLTLKAGSSSILLQGGCNAHFFITDGEVIKAW